MSDETSVSKFIAGYGHIMFDSALMGKINNFLASLSNGLDDLISDLIAELRAVTTSDAATIYIADGELLRFVYVQNETLERKDRMADERGASRYAGKTLPIDESSICGYVAKTKRPLMLADARNLPKGAPFTFNKEYDMATGFHTVSLLTIPIIDDVGDLAGVLQLVNHKDEDGNPAPFENWMSGYVLLLVENFFPMIARSFDRYRTTEPAPERQAGGEFRHLRLPRQDMYDSIRGQRYKPSEKLNKALPWLAGSGISWTRKDRNKESNISKRLISYAEYLNRFEDISSVIDIMLTEARDATRADAGTFYLVVGDKLRFLYVQNDTLFKDNSRRNHYINNEIPISSSSISGYVALERRSLNIPDVAELPDDATYSFNRSFDDASGYHTSSILAVPILGAGGAPIAVVQLINSLDTEGVPKPFDDSDVRYVNLLAGQTMPFLTRSIMTRRLIDSMLKMTNLRDPLETGGHVHRVGAFASEIYHRWAENKGVDNDTLRIEKDTLRLSAMLHDIGKVAVPDSILKKPGKLTDEEYAVMKTHCSCGASMYMSPDSKLERMAYQITLHHHERWDGKGYGGDAGSRPLSGEEIPIYARITSVADVLDALVFSRVYKSAWTFEDAMQELNSNAGSQFDPEVVRAALEVSDTLKAITERYK
jgi:HD-GYP domain-containing protein (c-di-GMP phosphodiesterase class II)